MSRLPYSILAIAVVASVFGCTHLRLRSSTLRQARTVTDIQYQQVLDNLAMFTVNPKSLPFFAVPGSGSTVVDTEATIGGQVGWAAATSGSLSPGASQRVSENWGLVPINSPDKLALMQCLYQRAVGYAAGSSQQCSDCSSLLVRWNVGTRPPYALHDAVANGWYRCGKKRDVPCDARHVGQFDGTYVWVPADRLGDLTRLTMLILDVATASDAVGVQPRIVAEQSVSKDEEAHATVVRLVAEIKELEELLEGAPEDWPQRTKLSEKIASLKETVQSIRTERPVVVTKSVESDAVLSRPRENFNNPFQGLIPALTQ